MEIDALLDHLAKLGVRVFVMDGRLKLRGPKAVLTEALVQEVSRHRQKLARRLCPHLFRLDYWRDAPAPGRPGWIITVCKHCGRFLGYRPSAN